MKINEEILNTFLKYQQAPPFKLYYTKCCHSQNIMLRYCKELDS